MIVVEILLAIASLVYWVVDLLRRYWWRMEYWQTVHCSLYSPETYRLVMEHLENEVRWEKWRYGH